MKSLQTFLVWSKQTEHLCVVISSRYLVCSSQPTHLLLCVKDVVPRTDTTPLLNTDHSLSLQAREWDCETRFLCSLTMSCFVTLPNFLVSSVITIFLLDDMYFERTVRCGPCLCEFQWKSFVILCFERN